MMYWPTEHLTGLFPDEYEFSAVDFNGKPYRKFDLWFGAWLDFVTWQMIYFINTGKIYDNES